MGPISKAIMFFITPQKEHLVYTSETGPEHGPSKKRRHQHYQPEPPSTQDVASGYYPRRVPKACDRCRVKKVKCSGGKLCKRCESDGVVCITTVNSEEEQGPVEARQYHLVESQRDRLLHIISEILHGKDETEVARLRELLSNMGLSVKNLPLSSLSWIRRRSTTSPALRGSDSVTSFKTKSRSASAPISATCIPQRSRGPQRMQMYRLTRKHCRRQTHSILMNSSIGIRSIPWAPRQINHGPSQHPTRAIPISSSRQNRICHYDIRIQ